MAFSVIRKSLSAKVSLALAAVTAALTLAAATVIVTNQSRALQDMILSKAKLAADLGAHSYGRLLEDGVDNGYLTAQDVFDRAYEPIKGYEWGPSPKYHTKYDFYTDRSVVEFEDRFLNADDFVAAMGADVNGYIPTHNTIYQKPLTGILAKDLEGNRTKRIFNDAVALKAGRSEDPFLVQTYKRDTGTTMLDVSSPVYVKGKHWGCFRVLVSLEEIDRKRMLLVGRLALMFGGFAVISSAAIFALVRRSMRPLVALATRADEISTGEGLDVRLRATTTDEVGMMTKSVDRLRASLKAAMSRLGE